MRGDRVIQADRAKSYPVLMQTAMATSKMREYTIKVVILFAVVLGAENGPFFAQKKSILRSRKKLKMVFPNPKLALQNSTPMSQ